MGLETDLILWEATDVEGVAFANDAANAVVATFPTKEGTYKRGYVPLDDTDEEGILFGAIMPEGFDANQDLKLEVKGWMVSAVAGSVDLHAALEAISETDEIQLASADSFDTENAGNAAVRATAEWPMTITITLANKDNVQPGDRIRIRLFRNTPGDDDTAVGDFNLNKMRLFQETT